MTCLGFMYQVDIALYYARVDDEECENESFMNYVANGSAIDTAWLAQTREWRLGDYIAIAPTPGRAIAVYMGTNEPEIGFDFGGTTADETIHPERITW